MYKNEKATIYITENNRPTIVSGRSSSEGRACPRVQGTSRGHAVPGRGPCAASRYGTPGPRGWRYREKEEGRYSSSGRRDGAAELVAYWRARGRGRRPPLCGSRTATAASRHRPRLSGGRRHPLTGPRSGPHARVRVVADIQPENFCRGRDMVGAKALITHPNLPQRPNDSTLCWST